MALRIAFSLTIPGCGSLAKHRRQVAVVLPGPVRPTSMLSKLSRPTNGVTRCTTPLILANLVNCRLPNNLVPLTVKIMVLVLPSVVQLRIPTAGRIVSVDTLLSRLPRNLIVRLSPALTKISLLITRCVISKPVSSVLIPLSLTTLSPCKTYCFPAAKN